MSRQSNISISLPAGSLLLACSGGRDSVVLLHLCLQAGRKPAVAHVNYGLRGEESDDDAQYVRELCKDYNLTCHVHRAPVMPDKTNLQQWARRVRYDYFEALRKDLGYDALLVGHHRDDNLETLLQRLGRGAGLQGLSVMQVQQGWIHRPMLQMSNEEVGAFAEANNISWREDASNQTDQYSRNRLRHDAIPALESAVPGWSDKAATSIVHLQEALQELTAHRNRLKKHVIQIKEDRHVLDLSQVEHPRMLYGLLQEYGFTDWETIREIDQLQTGRVVRSTTHQLLKDREFLVITLMTNTDHDSEYVLEAMPKTPVTLGNLSFEAVFSWDRGEDSPTSVCIDAARVKWPLRLRKWQAGDRLQPLGMQGTQKVSDLLVNKKLSLVDKARVRVLTDELGILWVVGHRLDARCRITETANQYLRVRIIS